MLLNDNFTKFECKSTLFPNVYSVIEVNAATWRTHAAHPPTTGSLSLNVPFNITPPIHSSLHVDLQFPPSRSHLLPSFILPFNLHFIIWVFRLGQICILFIHPLEYHLDDQSSYSSLQLILRLYTFAHSQTHIHSQYLLNTRGVTNFFNTSL